MKRSDYATLIIVLRRLEVLTAIDQLLPSLRPTNRRRKDQTRHQALQDAAALIRSNL